MSKIKIKTTIDEENFCFEGIKNKNSIIYKDSDVAVKIMITDIIRLTRENNDFKIELIFNEKEETKINYLLKQYNQTMELKLKTEKLNIDNNYIEILYDIVDTGDKKSFKLEFEEI